MRIVDQLQFLNRWTLMFANFGSDRMQSSPLPTALFLSFFVGGSAIMSCRYGTPLPALYLLSATGEEQQEVVGSYGLVMEWCAKGCVVQHSAFKTSQQLQL